MTTMLITFNGDRLNGNFMGDQLCSLKTAYLFVENQPDVDKVILTLSPSNEMQFIWQKFIDKYNVEVVYDDWHPGDWPTRHHNWDKWRTERHINGTPFDHYRELYLRIHGSLRQNIICGSERGLGRRNIYQYWICGQENLSDELPDSVDWFDDTLCYHPNRTNERDVYIAPHCKTQGNVTFTFDYWSEVVHRLIDAGVTVTVGYDGHFCWDLLDHPLYKRHWGSHEEWFAEVAKHKIVACGNTGTGWVSAACGVPLLTMEPYNSQMPDHRYRQCGLKNVIEIMHEPDAEYCAKRLIEFVNSKVVMTTGCYDILHAGHVRHLEKARSLGTKLIVALNSDSSVKQLKGSERPINPQNQRKAVLEALRCVDEVRIFDGENTLPLLTELKPDILACGFGYTPDTIVGKELVESWGGKVVVTCTGDASNEPSTTKIVKRIKKTPADVIEICRIATGYSVNPFEKLKLLADEFLAVLNLEGDVADLGTYQGGSALVLRRLGPDKFLHCFDTWEGTPHDDELCHHKKGEWKAELGDCRKVVGTDSQTNYYPCIFPNYSEDGLAPFWLGDLFFCFVNCDMDTYQSTKDAIEFFWSRIVSGGKIFFDDYGWLPCAGVRKVVDEFFPQGNGGDYVKRVYPNLYSCVVTKK